jgi:general secretion pathway protein I
MAQAFTMVEVIVALAILGVTLIALFGAMRTCAAAAHHNRMLTGAVLLAESLLTETLLAENPTFQTTRGRKGLYQWQVQVAPTPVENLAAVKVTIQWARQPHPQSYELVGLLHVKASLEGV